MKLGLWMARNGQKALIVEHAPGMTFPWRCCGGASWTDRGGHYQSTPSPYDLVHYLGPLELSPTPACAEDGPAGDPQTVSTEDPQESLRRMRAQCNALTREEAAYGELLTGVRRAKSDLEEAIKTLEKEVEG